jgi:hypothetical protein
MTPHHRRAEIMKEKVTVIVKMAGEYKIYFDKPT